jgi:transcriptional regulator with XRE-family HTH domain
VKYLSRKQVAERIGVKPSTLSRYKLPAADATIGDVRGWLPATVDTWDRQRPGQGARTDLHRQDKPA